MKKHHAWPKGHWDWPIKVSHKHGVRSRRHDVGRRPGRSHQHGRSAQWRRSGRADTQLHREFRPGAARSSAATSPISSNFCASMSMTAASTSGVSRNGRQGACRAGAKPAVTAVPVPYLAYPGMVVEIEGYAMRDADGAKLARRHARGERASPCPQPFVARRALRQDDLRQRPDRRSMRRDAWCSPAISSARPSRSCARSVRYSRAFGACFDDVVKINRWYVGQGTVEDFEPAALACAAHFNEPGPAATGIPLPASRASMASRSRSKSLRCSAKTASICRAAMSGPNSLWDWTVHLPYKHGLKCHDMIFLGGQVSLDKQGRAVEPGDLAAQARQAMTHIGTILNELGASYDDVCKVIAMYEGRCGADDLHENLSIRSSFFNDPGPATTGIPLPKLAYPGMVIEIDVFAMTDAGLTPKPLDVFQRKALCLRHAA